MHITLNILTVDRFIILIHKCVSLNFSDFAKFGKMKLVHASLEI